MAFPAWHFPHYQGAGMSRIIVRAQRAVYSIRNRRFAPHLITVWEEQMKNFKGAVLGASFLLAFTAGLEGDAAKIVGLITGQAAFVDAKDLKPGTFRKITKDDLPEPGTGTPGNAKVIPRGDNMPQAPAGFKVELFAHDDLKAPRQIRRAPNGD